VFFITTQEGWVVGGGFSQGQQLVLHTTNEGLAWQDQSQTIRNLNKNIHLNKVCFADKDHGFIVSNGDYSGLYTSDGGTTWASKDVSNDKYAILFTSTDEGWSAGTVYTIALTTNEGYSWTEKNRVSSANMLRAICFVATSEGWFVGDLGEILFTNNDGITWTKQTPPDASINFTGVSFLNTLEGYMVGSSGVILHTTNEGSSWTNGTNNPAEPAGYTCIKFVSSQEGWASTSSHLYRYLNGSWVKQPGNTGANDLFFVDPLHGWAVGSGGSILNCYP